MQRRLALYRLKLFEDGVGSAGCVSTEDCGSNNFVAARSSKIFIVLILLALEITGLQTPDVLAGYHTKPKSTVVMKFSI